MTQSPEERVMQQVLSQFDPDRFLLAEYTEALETDRTLIPQGEVKIDTIRDFEIIKPRLWKNPQTQEQVWLSPQLRLHMLITDQGVLDQLNAKRDEHIWRYQMNLDINENQQLDYGPNRNLQLGRLRAAIGQNVAGIPWSVMQLKNCPSFGVTVVHKQRKDSEEKDENISKWYRWGADPAAEMAA
jgi:hypothetical protein